MPTKTDKSNKPFHEEFAESIIAKLEQGTAPWQKPWKEGVPKFNHNPISGTRYKGINQLQLALAGFDDPRWMTFNQARDVGYSIKKGSKATTIVYYQFHKEIDKLDSQGKPVLDDEGKTITEMILLARPVIRYAKVFNAAQVDGIPPLEKQETQTWEIHQKAENILKNSKAVILHDQRNKAFYRPRTDSIHLPPKENFDERGKYYATALHELGHWTGHESRLNRLGGVTTEDYAKEELRAEIASWMLGDELGIGHDPDQHTAYVASWVKVLKEEPLEIIRACRDAEKAKELLMGYGHEKTLEAEAVEKTAWEQTVDAYMNNSVNRDKPLQMLDKTPLVMELVGAKNLPVEIKISTVKKVLEKHDLPIETLKQIPQALAEPIMIFDSATNDNLVLMLDVKDKQGATVVVPMELDKSSRNKYQVNEIASIYGRTKPLEKGTIQKTKEPNNEWFTEQIEKGQLRYIDHKKSQDWTVANGLWLPTRFSRLDNKNIHTADDLVKLKNARLQNIPEKEVVQERAVPRIAHEKTYLAVPYVEKDAAKAVGAKWDKAQKSWYASEGTDLAPLEKWLPTENIRERPTGLSPQEEFAIQLKDLGLDIQGLPVMNGQVQRVPLVDKTKGKDGAYCGYLDGIPAGWAQNHTTGVKINFVATGHTLSSEEKAYQQAERAQNALAREAAQKEIQNAVAQKCTALWEEHHLASSEHPYLVKKGIPAIDIKESPTGNTLLVPLRNVDGEVRGLQYINLEGGKYFEKSMEKKGNFHVIGGDDGKMPQTEEIILAEGYATGASLHMATKKPVAVAFDAGNLEPVAKKLREKFPKAKITICADNDHTKQRNIGVETAKRVAQVVGGTVKIPLFTTTEKAKGLTDFNDLHTSRGLSAVQKQLGVSRSHEKGKGRTL